MVISHKSVLRCVLADGMNLVLEKVTPTAITNSYKSILTLFVPDMIDIDTVISNILAKNPLVKVYPKIIVHDQLIANIRGKHSYNSIQKIWNSCPYLSGTDTTLRQSSMGVR